MDVGNVAVTGGSSAFHTVDVDGVIGKIVVEDFSSFGVCLVLMHRCMGRAPGQHDILVVVVAGHTTFFPGSSVGVRI